MASPDPVVEGLVDALAQASFVTMAVLSRIGSEHDLSLTQLRALGVLRDRRVRMSTLADHLGLERSTLSGLIDRAEKRDLVARAPSPADGRVVEVFLTSTGQALGATVSAEVAAALAPMLATLDRPDQKRLRQLLESLLPGDRTQFHVT